MASLSSPVESKEPIIIRRLRADEVEAAEKLMRFAFGTEIGLSDPLSFMGDASYINSRFQYLPILAAEVDGQLAGLNVVTIWGSFAYFGPLVVDPQHQGRKIAQHLVKAALDHMKNVDGVKHAGLYTFSNSTKHLHLYGRFGFQPGFLTYTLEKTMSDRLDDGLQVMQRFSEAVANGSSHHEQFLAEVLRITSQHVLEGLDLRSEVQAVQEHHFGDTVLVPGAFAVMHVGPGTEAGSGVCFVKFAAAENATSFRTLITAIESFAQQQGCITVRCGVNTSRYECYEVLQQCGGYWMVKAGVAMQMMLHDKWDEGTPGYNRGGVFVLDDWM